MNLTSFLLKSRGVVGLTKRVPGLFIRFGLTEGKIASRLHTFVDITERFGVYPTFAITANLIPRYPMLIRGLQDRGVEFAIHGLVHTDYAQLSLDEQRNHLKRAMQIFEDNRIKYQGFRCPYLSSNSDILVAVREMGLRWESSDVVSWDVLDLSSHTPYQVEAYKRVIDLYSARNTDMEKSVPRMIDGLVEIPVSVPDDEALVDRLGIKDCSKIALVWLDILRNSYERGEIFTIQLHHERIDFCSIALTRVLEGARNFRPHVWITQLKDISDWAFELRGTDLRLEQRDQNRHRFKVTGSSRATVLVKNANVNAPSKNWMDGYRVVTRREFEITSDTKPSIGISPDVSDQIVRQLRSDGFMVEVSDRSGDYGIFLSDATGVSYSDFLKTIEDSGKPIIRLWRWPHGARSALSCTGDIDSITIIDFARRFVEV